jgi:hypothetical protein
MHPALVYDPPDPLLEAGGDSTARRMQRANRAGIDTLTDRNKAERETVQQLLTRLKNLQTGLQQRLLSGDGGLTDFRRFHLQTLLGDVDRLIANATADLATLAQASYEKMAEVGADHATDPLHAAQLQIHRALPGIDSVLIQAAFGNTVDLLTAPMQQFATDVKVSVRRVALGGDNRFEEIQRLRDKISGQGFGAAQFKAERIIRTEMGRVFNQSTFDRLVALAKDFPFIRKGWRASKDNRTRLGHVQAAQTYARGQGIKIDSRFSINVHTERKGQEPKLIGTALLRYPIDPDATPAGKVAAGATIMCRCNSFVDFDPAQFAAFTAAKVQTALTGLTPPAAPKPAPLPAPKVAKMVKPKVKVPKVKIPTAADHLPQPVAPEQASGPTGTPVSAAIKVQAGLDLVAKALAEIDKVHGDGQLPTLPAVPARPKWRSKAAAYYAHNTELGFTAKLLKANPFMTVWHEVGHFLDHKGFGTIGGSFATESMALATSEQRVAFGKLMSAIKASKSIQTLVTWNQAELPGTGLHLGDGIVPAGVNRTFVNYLLRSKEAFARAYAQYMAEASGNPAALKALRNMQAASTTGPVSGASPYNPHSTTRAEAPVPGSWDYPWQWSDEDFAPIRAAFDDLFKAMEWRK